MHVCMCVYYVYIIHACILCIIHVCTMCIYVCTYVCACVYHNFPNNVVFLYKVGSSVCVGAVCTLCIAQFLFPQFTVHNVFLGDFNTSRLEFGWFQYVHLYR